MKKLSSLFVLLCASVMSFAATATDKVTMLGFGGLTSQSYTNVTTEGKSDNGIAMVAYAFNASNGQIRGNKTAVAGATIASKDDTKNFSLYNKTAMPGAIRSITLKMTNADNSNKLSAALYVSMGTATQGDVTTTTDATLGTYTASDNSCKWTFDGSTNYTFFKILSTSKFTSGSPKGAEITIEYEAGEIVAVPAESITLDKAEISLEQYKNTVAIVATVLPENTTDKVVWSSSNEEIATISQNGKINALKEGKVTLTATAGEKTATCELTVTAPTVLTCAQAAEKAMTASADNAIVEGGKYVIRGYMTAEAGKGFATDMEKYKNISLWMADERGTAKTFQAYGVIPAGAENLPEVGDLVEVVADLTKYKTTPETAVKSGNLTIIEKAPILYELNGGVLASTPAPATTNEALWKLFMPAYNAYYNLNRSEQPLTGVRSFLNNISEDIMTNEKSNWKWLGDYIWSVVLAQNFESAFTTVINGKTEQQTREFRWGFCIDAFFNCSAAKTAGNWSGNPDFTEAGKPEKWIAAWDATHSATLPERPTEATELPVPTREGYVFAGWYNNAEFTGEAITTVDATTKGTLYAKWEVEAIPATAIEMSEIGLNLTVGETFTLTVTVTPEDASLEGLTWTSSDEALATVKDGVVTAVAPTPDYEYVTITATLGELTATCDVAIYAALESIKFNTTEMDTEFEFEEGLEIPLTFDIQPANASTEGIIVTSSNTAVATITEQSFFGMTFFSMHVVGIGTTTLKVTTADGKLSDELVITVTPPAVHATAVTVDKETLTLNVGDTYQLVATMTPEDAVDVIEWNSSKPGVATVENGLVTAVGVGEATIWITAGWDASATCKVAVNDKGTGLENIAELDTNAPIYNVLGQEVSAEYKGVVIQNGKKFLLQ